MTDAGDALAVMGNHEYNTICYLTPDGRGGYLRPHVPRNELRHRAFIRGCGGDEARLEQAVAWMRGLPFFLELEQGKLRIVHACWAAPQIDAVRADPAPCRDPDFLRESVREGSPGHLIVKMLLRGPDEIVPEGEIWRDAYGRVRGKRRRQWWRDYPAASPPVVFGHYCRIGRPVEVGRNWACLDHCVDGGGALSCLRWSADSALCGLDECPSVSVPSRAG